MTFLNVAGKYTIQNVQELKDTKPVNENNVMELTSDYIDERELATALNDYATKTFVLSETEPLTVDVNGLKKDLVTVINEFNAHDHDLEYAAKDHTHEGLNVEEHNHDDRYSLLDHTHEGLNVEEHDHDDRYALVDHTHTEFEYLSVPKTLTVRQLDMTGAINTDTINMHGTMYVSSKPSGSDASNAYWDIHGQYFGSVDTNRLYFNCTRYSGTNRVIYINEPSQDITILNHTITHNAPVNEDIANFQIGSPVFTTGQVVHLKDDKYISGSENPIDCVTSVKSSGSYRQYLGICVAIHKSGESVTIGDTIKTDIELKQDTIDFATHCDFYFRVNDTSEYSVGDIVLFDGNKLSDDLIITTKIMSSIVGKVTGIIDDHLLCVFKD